MEKLTKLLLCLFLSIGVMTAQTTKVTGVVTSSDDGEPIIGASVLAKGTTFGTITNFDGTFSMDVPSSATAIVISYIGMVTQEVPVAPVVNVVLQVNAEALDEVVVTAMGISREKKSLGYALQEVKSEDLTKAGQQNVLTSLSGRIAGVQVTQQGGQIGASSNIVIRGNSSFGNNQPLIVLDGVPITNDNSTGATVNLGSGLNDINPNDIESISVLKGGSAALYGMRAGNGVVVVTTKSGKKGEGVKVSYDGDFTVDKIYGLPHFQNKYGQGFNGSEWDYKESGFSGSYQEFAVQRSFSYADGMGGGVNDDADESWGARLDIGLMVPQVNSPIVGGVRQATPWVSNKNNIKDFFETGYSTNHTISLTSTTEKSSTRASLSIRDQRGTLPNTDQKRYSAAINTSMKINSHFDFDLSANYMYLHSDNLPGTGYNGSNPMQVLMQWHGRQIDMKDLKANYEQMENGEYTHYNWQQAYATNPYWVMYKNTNEYDRHRIYGKSSLWYKPTDYLKFEARIGIDQMSSEQLSRWLWSVDYPNGYFRDYSRGTTEINADFLAYFTKQIGDFNINALAGANYRDYKYFIKGIGADNLVVPGLYTVTNAVGKAHVEENHEDRRSNSIYANFSFGWKNQVYVDISMRNDWDSTIEEAFFYPSFSGSWILTETFPSMTENDWFDYMKVRGGWAKIGSATTPYRSGSYYAAETNGMHGATLFRNPIIYPPTGLRPEMVKTWELGLEANFLNNRLHFDGSYYERTTTDQIMEVNTARATGYNSMLVNAGEIFNRGVELSISADIFKNPKGFSWTSTLNWSKDKSKIVELYTDAVTGESLQTYQVGSSWSVRNYAMPGKSWGTLVGTGYVRNDDGSILVEDGMPVYANSQEIGDVTPDWLAGWHNSFSYKDWSLGFLLDFRMGGDIYSLSQAFGPYCGIYDFTAKGDMRENGVIVGQNVLEDKVFKTADGQINNTAVGAQDFFSNFYSIAEMAIIDGSYLKLRELYITYNVPKSFLTRTKHISAANISLIGTNLAMLWKHKSNLVNLDPESTTASGNTGIGFESNTYPPTRSIGIKLGLTF